MNQSLRQAPPIAAAILGTLAVAALGLLGWAVPRGFDFLDGALYYLTYQYPREVVDLHTSYHLFGRVVWLAVGENVIAFRLASWGVIFSAVLVFDWGFGNHLRFLWPAALATRAERLSLRLALLLASLAVYGFHAAALNYNSLNAAGIFATTGLLLAAITPGDSPGAGRTRAWTLLAGAGVIMTLLLFIKPTTSLLLGAGSLTLLQSTPLVSRRTKVATVACGALGVAVGLLGVVLLLGGVGGVRARVQNLEWLAGNTLYVGTLLTRVGGEFRALVEMLWADTRPAFAAVLVCALALLFLRSRPPAVRLRLFGVTMALAVGAWLWRVGAAGLWHGGHGPASEGLCARFFLGAILLALALAGVARLALSAPSPSLARLWHLALVFLFLLLAPFAGAFGTSNAIFLNSVFQAPLWLACVVLLALPLAHRLASPAVWLAPITLVAAGSFVQFYDGHIAHPYMQRAGLAAQDTPTPIGSPATTLRLDAETSRFLVECRRLLTTHGFRPGDDIFGLFNIPGIVFAVGGRSPIVPWYFGGYYHGDNTDGVRIYTAGAARIARAFVITQADVTIFSAQLHSAGMAFPEGYDLLGELTSPATGLPIRLWKPRAAVARP